MAKNAAAGARAKKTATTTKNLTNKNRSRDSRTAKPKDRTIEVISSKLSYDGPLFRVYTDHVRDGDKTIRRDVIRHNGSAVILALDDAGKQDPLVVVERQYRHAAGQYLLEMPAGKLEQGEDALEGAKRELFEETGFKAKRWRKLVRYFASPGFLGEWMQVFIADGLTAGEAHPEYDERIEVQMVRFSVLLGLIEQGKIYDGKTLIAASLYDRLRRRTGSRSIGKKK